MIYNLILEAWFDRERFIEKLFIEILLLLMNKNAGITSFIKLRATSSADHLKKIGQREVNITPDFGIKEFCALYNH
jgi:hypothetical protein